MRGTASTTRTGRRTVTGLRSPERGWHDGGEQPMTVAWFLTTSQGAATRRSTALASPEPRMAYFPWDAGEVRSPSGQTGRDHSGTPVSLARSSHPRVPHRAYPSWGCGCTPALASDPGQRQVRCVWGCIVPSEASRQGCRACGHQKAHQLRRRGPQAGGYVAWRAPGDQLAIERASLVWAGQARGALDASDCRALARG